MTEGWRTVSIAEVADVVNGGTPKTQRAEFWGGTHLWITPAEMGNRSTPYLGESRRTLTDAGLSGCSASLVPKKSVILSTRAPIGHLAINTEPMAFNQGCRAVVPGRQLNYKYLYYFLSGSVKRLDDLGSGTTFKELPAGKLKRFQLPIPPLSEQKRIVAILDEAFSGIDAAIANTEKNLANARELFDSYLNLAFCRTGNNWKEAKLQDSIEITHGFSFQSRDFQTSQDTNKLIVLTPGNYESSGNLFFTPKNTKRLVGSPPRGYRFDRGDLTIVMTDLSQKMKILGKPAFIESSNILHNQRIGRVIFKSTVLNPRFLYYFLMTNKVIDEIKRTATGTTVRHTAPKRILNIRIGFPSKKSKQDELVDRCDELREKTMELQSVYKKQLDVFQELRHSLLQKAFSGELTAATAEQSADETVA